MTFLSLVVICQGQTRWVANNNPGASGGVNVTTGATALQDAIDQAANGDIIYVTPSITVYPAATVNKPLTIIGSGIRPLKESGLKSEGVRIDLSAGSSGSSIIGMTLSEVDLGANNVNISDILITNCRVEKIDQNSYPNAGTLSNILVQNNIITSLNTGNTASNIELPVGSNMKVSNNIIYTVFSGGRGFQTDNVEFENNIICWSGTGSTFYVTNNCTFRRNIFYGTATIANTSNVFVENLSFGGSEVDFNANPSNSGNIVDQDPLFENFPLNNTWDNLYDINLQAGSPAIQDINDRTKDIGPTGGLTPFNDEGNNLPLIQSFQVPGLVSQGSDLPVEIKGKGN